MNFRGFACILSACIGGVSALASSGCANLEATKVPLSARIHGCDNGQKYDGFRYYMSRPHIVVSERVDLGSTHQLARLAVLSHPQSDDMKEVIVLEPLMEHDQRYWNFESGELLDVDGYKEQGYRINTFVSPAENSDAAKSIGEGSSSGVLQTALMQQVNVPDVLGRDAISRSLALSVLDGDGEKPVIVKPEAFQVFHLPDFEEQMRVKHKNCLAYSKIDLHFADGWQLQEAGGSFDSTEVAARVLQSLSSAISASTEVQAAALKKLPATPAGGPSSADILGNAKERDEVVVLVKESQYIVPGIYRLQKSWEMANGANGPRGMLTNLGLPVQNETTFHIIQ
jgi:hypothetical protein